MASQIVVVVVPFVAEWKRKKTGRREPPSGQEAPWAPRGCQLALKHSLAFCVAHDVAGLEAFLAFGRSRWDLCKFSHLERSFR